MQNHQDTEPPAAPITLTVELNLGLTAVASITGLSADDVGDLVVAGDLRSVEREGTLLVPVHWLAEAFPHTAARTMADAVVGLGALCNALIESKAA